MGKYIECPKCHNVTLIKIEESNNYYICDECAYECYETGDGFEPIDNKVICEECEHYTPYLTCEIFKVPHNKKCNNFQAW